MITDERILELWRTLRVPDGLIEWFEVANFARAVEAETLEAAAKVCDQRARDHAECTASSPYESAEASECAAAIRTLTKETRWKRT